MSDESHEAESGPSQLLAENAFAVLTGAFGIIMLIGTLNVGIDWGIEGPRPGFFPFYLSLIIIIASIVNLVQVNLEGGVKSGTFSNWEQLRRVLSVVVPSVAYVAFVPLLGIYVSSMLLIAVFMIWLGSYAVWATLPIAIGIPVIAYVVFERNFQIALPKGPIEFWLGL